MEKVMNLQAIISQMLDLQCRITYAKARIESGVDYTSGYVENLESMLYALKVVVGIKNVCA